MPWVALAGWIWLPWARNRPGWLDQDAMGDLDQPGWVELADPIDLAGLTWSTWIELARLIQPTCIDWACSIWLTRSTLPATALTISLSLHLASYDLARSACIVSTCLESSRS